ncbi:MAG: hypothetical protein BBJ57_05785 [Desulfobacterales bacterium PC51MH44]|nr:MAG: hypothetical protein BBJ57_05785 [Desulfobacterales bacterium PC51MH44]
MKKRFLIYLVLHSLIFGYSAFAQKSLPSEGNEKWKWQRSFSPDTLENDGTWGASLDYKISLTGELFAEPKYVNSSGKDITEFRKKLDLRLASEGSVATDADLNTKPLKADARLAFAVNLYKATRTIPGDTPKSSTVISKGFDLGRADFSIVGGYETDQRLDNRNFTAGGELACVQTRHDGLRGFIPSIFLGYDLIRVDTSQIQKDLGVDDRNAERFRAFAKWKLKIGGWISETLDPLDLHIDLRYYKTESLPDALNNADQDEATYAAGTLKYSFTGKEPWGIINAVFVRIDDGRIPPTTEDGSTITFGVTMFEM